MAGSSVTTTVRNIGDGCEIKFVWVSDDATGSVSSTKTMEFIGVPVRFTTVPNGGGTAPTALYDIAITDHNGIDILNNLGADRSATVTESKVQSDGLLFMMATSLTFAVTNAGNAKGGTAYLYLVNMWNEPV